jgi:pyrroline-5-carboxylate reductase
MCEAIVRGLLSSSLAAEIIILEVFEERITVLKRIFPRVTITKSTTELLESSDIVVIAVKPQQLKAACAELGNVAGDKLFISICAGVSLDVLHGCMSHSPRIARVMPNLAAMVGEGAAGFALGKNCSEADGEIVQKIFSTVGAVVEQVPESLMDVVTGVSGSGPAFVCLMIEAMADAGVKHGMSRSTALRLAAQTCVGAGKLVLQGGDSSHPAVIKDKVCSPGGTSIAGVAELENNGFRAAIIAAVSAAVDRSVELGKK